MQKRHIFSFVVALGSTVLVAHSGAAQPASTPGATDAADVAFRQGNTFYEQKRFPEAKAAYEAAFRAKRAHDIAANLAYAEIKLGLYRDAAEHLTFAVSNWAPTGKDENRKSAIHFLAVAKAQVVTLKVAVNLDNAAVQVDGKPIGMSPLSSEVFVDPGSHALTATLAGYGDVQQVVQGARGQEVEVRLTLSTASSASPAAGPGSTAAGPGSETNPGAGGVPPTKSREPRSLVPAYVLGGLGLGAAAVGAGLMVAANGKQSDASSLQSAIRSSGGYCAAGATDSRCSTLHSDTSSEQTMAQVGVGMFVGSAAALGVAGIYLLLPRSSSSDSQPKVTAAPLFLPGGGGLVLQGSL